MRLGAGLATFAFELKRMKTFGRLAWWLALALFPPLITWIVTADGSHLALAAGPQGAVWLVFLLAGVVCLLGLLLSATPVIASELEARNWSYLTVRPHAKTSVLLGKYFAAVFWAFTAAWAGFTLSFTTGGLWGDVLLWLQTSAVLALGSAAYGALYTLLGVIFLRRAMVISVAFTLLFEVVVALVPAVVNQLTVNFRLRSLLVKVLPTTDLPEELALLVGFEPAWQHVGILLTYTVALLAAAAAVLNQRELVTAEGHDPA